MKNNVIFLDIDGVLNTSYTAARTPNGGYGVDEDKVVLLLQIVKETNAIIVLVSSWKECWGKDAIDDNDGKYLDQEFKKQGIYINDKTKLDSNNRGDGICLYLKEHNIGNFVILDDYVFQDYRTNNLIPHLCLCDWVEDGLTNELVEKAINILKGEI